MKSVIIGNAELWLGDSLEIMKLRQIDFSERVNLVVSDPPYALESGGKTGEMAGKFSKDIYDNGGNLFECEIPDWKDFMPLVYQSMNDSGHAYFMANNRHIANCENAALQAGFRLHNWLVWDKGTATPNRWYMKNCEFIGFFFKGKAFAINDCGAKQTISCPAGKETNHPTEKPVQLMEYYIKNSTNPADTVLDPFMGSGSTGVAAIKSGRKFIGIERNEEFFNICVERISNTLDKEHWGLFRC